MTEQENPYASPQADCDPPGVERMPMSVLVAIVCEAAFVALLWMGVATNYAHNPDTFDLFSLLLPLLCLLLYHWSCPQEPLCGLLGERFPLGRIMPLCACTSRW